MTAGDERYFKLAEEHLYGELAIVLELKRTRLVPILRKESRKMYKKIVVRKKLQKNVKKVPEDKRFYDIMRYMVK